MGKLRLQPRRDARVSADEQRQHLSHADGVSAMKVEEAGKKICPMMSRVIDVGWQSAWCLGPGCACWETTKRKLEEMEYEVLGHQHFISNATLPEELKQAGWYMTNLSSQRTPEGKYVVTLYRYTDILEGECGLTHPREG